MNTQKLLLGTLLATSLALTAIAPASAQEVEPANDTAVVVDDDDRYDRDDDDGFDWGLLGLLGLLGLIPRKSKEVVVHRDAPIRDPNDPNGPNRL